MARDADRRFQPNEKPAVKLRTLDQRATAVRALTEHYRTFRQAVAIFQSGNEWGQFLEFVATRDGVLAGGLRTWSHVDGVAIMEALQHGDQPREPLWRFTRDLRATLVTHGFGVELVVETQTGRHYAETFKTREQAIRKANELRAKLKASWQWAEDDAATTPDAPE